MFVNLIRGSPKHESIVGLQTCGGASWSILVGFVLLCGLITLYSIRSVRREYLVKKEMGALCPSDINVLDKKTLAYILSMSFLGSFLGNSLGLGGGFIYTPV